MSIITEAISLESITCCKCFAVFALNCRFVREAKESSVGFYCPHCQTWQGWWDSEVERLRKQLSETEMKLRQSKCEILDQQNLREKAERKLKRIGKGVCPCCNRSFIALGRHIKTKHPDFKP